MKEFDTYLARQEERFFGGIVPIKIKGVNLSSISIDVEGKGFEISIMSIQKTQCISPSDKKNPPNSR
ncbi:hypothetical protein LPY66_02400 [Dehalobacter sp. DCM]|uniref:hypothetical protein n=1 Tax=Dehalobacter sp. DCM TaxID=2907827 RepID=UPI0030812EE5|nr:hypothetical protein LPY66_02400 [Dehalobacter sp. DCM]